MPKEAALGILVNNHESLSSAEQHASIASPKNSHISSRKLQNHETSIKNCIFYSLPSDSYFHFKAQPMPICKFLHYPKSLKEAEILI